MLHESNIPTKYTRILFFGILYNENYWSSSHDVVVNVLDCDIVINEFEFQSRYYVHFRANTFGKGMNSLIPHPAIGKIISLLDSYKDAFGIKWLNKVDVPLTKEINKLTETICRWKSANEIMNI